MPAARGVLILIAAAGTLSATVPARAAVAFPDVPPWHWAAAAVAKDQAAGVLIGYPSTPAELAENSIVQVYDGFAHASAPGARAWVERFTYNRPAIWPAPLGHARVVSYSLTGMHVVVRGETATATFTARVETEGSASVTIPMHVALRASTEDWQVDYATLASASPLFR